MAAAQAGLSAGSALFLSAVIYAGASQFVALALITAGAPVLLGVVTLLAMNARHLFYGPALIERVGEWRAPRYAALWSFGLTDEVFAATLATVTSRRRGEQRARPRAVWSESWMTGIGLGAYLAWVGGTGVGGWLGGEALVGYPFLAAALGFMLPALFIALLLSLVTRRLMPVAACAAVSCLLGAWLSASVTTGILIGMLAGGAFAVWWGRAVPAAEQAGSAVTTDLDGDAAEVRGQP